MLGLDHGLQLDGCCGLGWCHFIVVVAQVSNFFKGVPAFPRALRVALNAVGGRASRVRERHKT